MGWNYGRHRGEDQSNALIVGGKVTSPKSSHNNWYGNGGACHIHDYTSVTGNPEAIAFSLVQQIRNKYPNIDAPPIETHPTQPDQLEYFVRAMAKSVSKAGDEPEVVYIDAADQANLINGPLLPGLFRSPEPGVIFVITSRPDERWIGMRDSVTMLKLRREQAKEKNQISSTKSTTFYFDDESDIRTYLLRVLPRVQPPISDPDQEELIRKITLSDDAPVFFTVRKQFERMADDTTSAEAKSALLRDKSLWFGLPQ